MDRNIVSDGLRIDRQHPDYAFGPSYEVDDSIATAFTSARREKSRVSIKPSNSLLYGIAVVSQADADHDRHCEAVRIGGPLENL